MTVGAVAGIVAPVFLDKRFPCAAYVKGFILPDRTHLDSAAPDVLPDRPLCDLAM